jgi:hypothetical protein
MTTYKPKPTIFQTCMVLLALFYWPPQGTAQVSTNVVYRFLHDGLTKSGYSQGEGVRPRGSSKQTKSAQGSLCFRAFSPHERRSLTGSIADRCIM